MKLQKSITLNEIRTSKHVQVLTATLMTNVHRLVVSTSKREICFIDASSLQLTNKIEMPEMVTSMNHYSDSNNPTESLLLLGDLKGYVTVIRFMEATTKLFNDPVGHDGVCWTLKNIEQLQPDSPLSTVVTASRK